MTKIEDFGAVADLTRIVVSIDVSVNDQRVTTTSATFAATDVGKVICIKQARDASSYSSNKATLTAKIVTYNSATSVDIDTAADYDVTDGDAYFYTNNYDAIQDAIDHCATNDIGILFAETEGVFGIDPWMSSNVPVDPDDYKANGLQLGESSLNIKGGGKGVTNFKWCVEDNFETDIASRYKFSGFVIKYSGDFVFEDFTMLAPDRLTTEVINQRDYGFYLSPVGTNLIDATVTLRNIDIIGDQAGGYEYADLQWSHGMLSSSSESDVQSYFYNVVIKADAQGIAHFDGDGNKQVFTAEDLNIYYTGSPLLTLDYGDGSTTGASTDASTDKVTVNVPGFSFYDLVVNDTRDLVVVLDLGGSLLECPVQTIISSTEMTTSTDILTNYSDKVFYITRNNGNSDQFFGHSLYIHPSVTMNINGYTAFYANGYRMHVYSGGGTQYGAAYRYLNYMKQYDANNPLFPGLDSMHGWLMSTDQTSANYITNSEIIFYNGTDVVDYKFYDTRFLDPANNGVTFNGNVDLVGCTLPSAYQYGDAKVLNLINCHVDDQIATNFNGIINTYNTYYDRKRRYPSGTPSGTINSLEKLCFKQDEYKFEYFDNAAGTEVSGVGGMYTTSPKSVYYLKNVVEDDFSTAVFDGKDGQTADVLRVRRHDGEDNLTVSNSSSTDVHQGLTVSNRLSGEDIIKILKGSPATVAVSVEEDGVTNINDGLNLSGPVVWNVKYNDAHLKYGPYVFGELAGVSGTPTVGALLRLNNLVDDAWAALVLDAKSSQSSHIMRVRNSSLDDQLYITKDFGLKMDTTTDTFSPPKLDSTQISALTPAAGDIVYNTSTNKHQGYDGTSWNDMY